MTQEKEHTKLDIVDEKLEVVVEGMKGTAVGKKAANKLSIMYCEETAGAFLMNKILLCLAFIIISFPLMENYKVLVILKYICIVLSSIDAVCSVITYYKPFNLVTNLLLICSVIKTIFLLFILYFTSASHFIYFFIIGIALLTLSLSFDAAYFLFSKIRTEKIGEEHPIKKEPEQSTSFF